MSKEGYLFEGIFHSSGFLLTNRIFYAENNQSDRWIDYENLIKKIAGTRNTMTVFRIYLYIFENVVKSHPSL